MMVTDLQAYCRWFNKRGHRILPMLPFRATESGGFACSCKDGPMCPNPGKHPAMKFARGEQLRLPVGRENAGILIGAGHAVLDIDNEEVLADLPEILGFELPETLMVKSPRGMHYWFTAPRPFVKVLGLYQKVDLLTGDNGYVLAPGSCAPHKDTGGLGCYEVFHSVEMAPLPERLLSRAPKPRSQGPLGTMAPKTMRYYWPKVDEACEAIMALQPGNRNGGLYTIALHLFRDWGVVGADAIPYMIRAAERPDFSAAEAARTIESARRAVYN